MKLSLTYKFFFNLLTAIGIVVTGMFFLMQYSFDRGFLNYVNTKEMERLEALAINLESAYLEQGEDWQFLQSNRRRWQQFLRDSQPEDVRPTPKPNLPGAGRPRDRHRQQEPLRPGIANRKPPRSLAPPGPSALEPHDTPQRFERRVILMDSEINYLFGPSDHPEVIKSRVLKNGAVPIGYLQLIPQKHLSDDLQLRFVSEQKRH